jgi:hypothetical protein
VHRKERSIIKSRDHALIAFCFTEAIFFLCWNLGIPNLVRKDEQFGVGGLRIDEMRSV